jgi:NitT/TauT family transport system substrate-binding protein
MAITLYENLRALFYAPFYAAYTLGAYKAEGVDVRMQLSPSPNANVEALRSGAADVCWGGPLRVLLDHDRNPQSDLVCFLEVVAKDPFFIVGRRPNPNFRLVDLKGIKFASVAEVPTPWICLAGDLRQAGIDPASLERDASHGMAENEAALRAGRLDAFQAFQPYVEAPIADGAGHVWYAQASRGFTAYTSFYALRSTIAAKRGEFQAMARAMTRALGWVQSHSGTDLAAAAASYFPEVPQPLFAAANERYKALGLWATDPVNSREGFDRLKAAMLADRFITRGAPYEECVDTTLASEAKGASLAPL